MHRPLAPRWIARIGVVVLVSLVVGSDVAAAAEPLVLLDAAEPDTRRVELSGLKQIPHRDHDGTWLRLVPTEGNAAAFSLAAPDGGWDLSSYGHVAIALRNPTRQPMLVRARAENATAERLMDACRTAAVLMPGEARELRIRLMPRPEDPGYDVFQPFYMYFKAINVRDNTIDPAAVARVVVSIDHPEPGQPVELGAIRAAGDGASAAAPFFPFIDEYGQYMHTHWPGKIEGDDAFATRLEEEAQERKDWPGPSSWNQYGGWADGPQLKATGFFYAAKHSGKWWLVDPEGRLFWSNGPTGVGFGGDLTPVSDREHWFASLPPRDSEMGRFYREGKRATYRYYKDREWLGYDIGAANLFRKYGEDYREDVARIMHDRLRSWGFNTIANWSAAEVYLLRKTPYTVAIHYGSPTIHYRMPDIYHPDWEPAVRERMERERDTTAGDPWNIGYFVDNERWWGWRPRAACVGEETLKNPADAPSKIEFLRQLKEKYDTIDALNRAWGTQHASWEALAEHREPPDLKNETALRDCGDFGMRFAERYFSIVSDAVKDVAPNNLYLGVRFHGHVDKEVVRLAAKYCDVISYNIYDNPPDGRINQYRELDVPIMSTEWGVGSDPYQTPFRGDNRSPDPNERAQAVARYLERAIRHPNMVGAHFFQLRDQPLSGRPDGEATLRGLLNIVDTPSFELIQANRRVAYDLYRTRMEAK